MTARASDFLAFGRRHGTAGRIAIEAVAQLHCGDGAAWEFQRLEREVCPPIVWWPSRPSQVTIAGLALAGLHVARLATPARQLRGQRVQLTDNDTPELERLAKSFIRNEKFGTIGYWTEDSLSDAAFIVGENFTEKPEESGA